MPWSEDLIIRQR